MRLGMMAHTSNFSYSEKEAGGCEFELNLCKKINKTLSQKEKNYK
jgi:hypothetical protein